MPDAFDRLPGQDTAKGDAFDRFPVQEESAGKSALRTGYQFVSGALQASTYPVDLMHMIALGESLDPEEIDRLRAISEREGIPFDEEKYMEDLQRLAESFPTQGNIERGIEERTGAPLEAKTRLQKGIKFATSVAKVLPKTGGSNAPFGTGLRGTNTAVPRPVTGAAVEGIKEGLVEAGLPEPISELASLLAIKHMEPGSSSINIGKEKKPSGLTTRKYEKLTAPKKVSEPKIKKINEKVESEFRDIAEDILAKSPIGETHSGLKNDVTFKQAARQGFERVEALAEQIPTPIATRDVKKAIIDRMGKKKGTGFTPSEYEKSHNKFVNEFIKETPDMEVTPSDLVKQFRKNNKGFGEINEPGQSYAYNQAKRDALRDYNLAIEDVINEKFPDSEFPKIFKDVNENWSKIMDAETIDKFMNDLFDGKIQFKKGREFFDKNGMTKPFERALGKEGFKNFETLMKDLMDTEKANSMMKVAKAKGFGELAEIGLGYVLHPTIGKAKIAYGIVKGTFKKGVEMLLDKPQLAVTWDRGVKAFKKGDFKTAEAEFKILEKERERAEALGKFNERLKKTKVENESPQYHGSPQEISNPSEAHYNDKNVYGQGFYTTDAKDVAKGYSERKGAKSPAIYEVAEKGPVKIYEMDKPINPEIYTDLKKIKHSEIADYLREDMTLTELFDEIRNDARSSDSIQEDFALIQEILRDNGYGGMEHSGGKLTKGKPHKVKIYFDPQKQINIRKINS